MSQKLIQQIIKEAIISVLDEKSKDDIPDIVHFKGQWVKPDEKHIEDQLKLASCLYHISYRDLIKKLEKAKEEILTNDVWSDLDNTLSFQVKTVEKAKELADEYGHHYNDVLFGYVNDRSVTLPVIIMKNAMKPYVVSGETELLFASAFKIKPKVLFVKL